MAIGLRERGYYWVQRRGCEPQIAYYMNGTFQLIGKKGEYAEEEFKTIGDRIVMDLKSMPYKP